MLFGKNSSPSQATLWPQAHGDGQSVPKASIHRKNRALSCSQECNYTRQHTVVLTAGSHCVGDFNSLALSDTGLFGPVVLNREVSKSAINSRKSPSLPRIIIHPETVLNSHQTALPSCSLRLKAEEMSTSYLWTRQSIYLSQEAEERLGTQHRTTPKDH